MFLAATKLLIDFDQNLVFPDCNFIFYFTHGYEMMHKTWSSIEEVPYYFSVSSVKIKGHTRQKFADFDHRRCALLFPMSSVTFWGHRRPKRSNFDPNWSFPDCNSSLNSPMVLKWCTKLAHWHSIDKVSYCFVRSSIKFPGHMGPKVNDLNPISSKNTRPVAAIKSLRFALLYM